MVDPAMLHRDEILPSLMKVSRRMVSKPTRGAYFSSGLLPQQTSNSPEKFFVFNSSLQDLSLRDDDWFRKDFPGIETINKQTTVSY